MTFMDGKFREYLEAETEFTQLQVRERREAVRRVALDYSHIEQVPMEELDDIEIEALMLYTQFRFDTGYEPPSSGAVSLDVSDAREPEGFEGGVAAGGSELSRG